ncbi:MAG: HAMP domain-containing histidine kinase [Blautia sp.]|nr:HAMP domain-containing histidine kinase [Blautia sp.]
MSGRSRLQRILYGLKNYAIFFLLIAFVITCSMILFLFMMQRSMDITLGEKDIRQAAILTFGNVLFLSLLCTVIDALRRRFMVERPVRRIIAASEKLMKGDLSVRIAPFHGFDGEDGFNIIIEYFNRMAEELGSVETLRLDFISNVSHELKTPLAVIQNYGTMLQSPDLSEEQRMEYTKAVSEYSRRQAALIANILKLNRLENQQIYPAAKRYDLGEQLAECLLDFENIWEEKKIEIDTDMEEAVLVEADAELLSLVWNNLFSNAFKFTESRGRVSLSMKTEGELAVVSVSDTGCGIAEETGRHIFEKFYQGDISHATQGNGLGLALVKRVMDIVHGEISVRSEVGKGSTFTVKIRRTQDGKTETDS